MAFLGPGGGPGGAAGLPRGAGGAAPGGHRPRRPEAGQRPAQAVRQHQAPRRRLGGRIARPAAPPGVAAGLRGAGGLGRRRGRAARAWPAGPPPNGALSRGRRCGRTAGRSVAAPPPARVPRPPCSAGRGPAAPGGAPPAERGRLPERRSAWPSGRATRRGRRRARLGTRPLDEIDPGDEPREGHGRGPREGSAGPRPTPSLVAATSQVPSPCPVSLKASRRCPSRKRQAWPPGRRRFARCCLTSPAGRGPSAGSPKNRRASARRCDCLCRPSRSYCKCPGRHPRRCPPRPPRGRPGRHPE